MKVKVEKEWQKLASLLNRENDDLPSDALDVLDEEKKKIISRLTVIMGMPQK